MSNDPKHVNNRKWELADNITFDAVIESPYFTTRQVEWLQKKAYFWTDLGLLLFCALLFP